MPPKKVERNYSQKIYYLKNITKYANLLVLPYLFITYMCKCKNLIKSGNIITIFIENKLVLKK